MTGPELHLVAPDELPARRVDDDSLQVLNDAIETLARRHTLYWLGDTSVQLRALASLIAQSEHLLPEAVHEARDQEFTWAQIGQLLNNTTTEPPKNLRW